MTIIDYTIISRPTAEDLESAVRAAIRDSWQPIGGVTVIQIGQAFAFCQAMVMYSA